MFDGRGKARVCFCHSLSVIIIVTIALIRHNTIAGGLMWSQPLMGLLSQLKGKLLNIEGDKNQIKWRKMERLLRTTQLKTE